MNPKFTFLFYWTHLPKLMCIYLSIWAYRRTGNVDYALDRFTKIVRWTLPATLLLLATNFPVPNGRVVLLCMGLAFLCWPNFSYRLVKLFRKHRWPTAEGIIQRVERADSVASVSYSFRYHGETYGGTSALKVSDTLSDCLQTESVMVRYDPLNPENSEIVGSGGRSLEGDTCR